MQAVLIGLVLSLSQCVSILSLFLSKALQHCVTHLMTYHERSEEVRDVSSPFCSHIVWLDLLGACAFRLLLLIFSSALSMVLNRRTQADLRAFLQVPPPSVAHRAAADVAVLAEILKALARKAGGGLQGLMALNCKRKHQSTFAEYEGELA